jgi:hypothetical protein
MFFYTTVIFFPLWVRTACGERSRTAAASFRSDLPGPPFDGFGQLTAGKLRTSRPRLQKIHPRYTPKKRAPSAEAPFTQKLHDLTAAA